MEHARARVLPEELHLFEDPDTDTHPADEALGALDGSGERCVDESVLYLGSCGIST